MADHWPYGRSLAVAAYGTTAMVNSGAAIKFVDIAVPRLPVVFAEVVIDHEPLGMALNQALAVIVDDDNFLHVVDLHSAAGPEIVGTTRIVGSAYRPTVELAGSVAYVAADTWGMRIVDLADPTHPVEIGFVNPPSEGAVDVSVSGSIAVVASEEAGLWIVDVSDPSNPSRISVFPQYTSRVAAHGTTAFTQGAGEMRVVDFSVAASPVQVGIFDLGYSVGLFTLDQSGNHVYLVGESRLKVIDVGDPTNPVEVGETTTTVSLSAIASAGTHVVTTRELLDFQVFNTEVPSAPYLEGWLVQRYGWNERVTVDEDKVYLAEHGSFRILDVADPWNVLELSTVFDPEFANGVAVDGDHAFVGGQRSLTVVDVSDPGAPVIDTTFDFPFPFSPDPLAVSQGHLFVGEHDELRVLDISDPLQPSEVAVLAVSTSDFVISGQYAYSYTNYPGSFNIIDISTPWNPFVVTSFPVSTHPNSLGADGGLLVLDSNSGGITVYDVSIPESPTELGSLNGLSLHAITVAGNRAYLSAASLDSSIHTIDLSDPANPTLIHTVPSPRPLGITVDGSRLFVANGTIGMSVFVDCSLFQDDFESGDPFAWSEVVQ